MFFGEPVQRAWIRADKVRRFDPDPDKADANATIAAPSKTKIALSASRLGKKARETLSKAEEEAKLATKLSIRRRLEKYSFISRYKGQYFNVKPTSVNKGRKSRK